MNRRSFVGSGLAALGAGSLVFLIQPTEEQVSQLEAEVDSLDERVTALETRVADLGLEDQGSSESVTDNEEEGQSVSGVGTMVSDTFSLQSGRYRVNARLEPVSDFTGFTVYVHSPSGASELVFNEIIEGAGMWEGSTIYQAPEAGEYFVEVGNTDSPWTLSFEKF